MRRRSISLTSLCLIAYASNPSSRRIWATRLLFSSLFMIWLLYHNPTLSVSITQCYTFLPFYTVQKILTNTVNYRGYFAQSNFRNSSVSSELPTSQHSVVKNPASNSHFSNHNKTPHLFNFLSLFTLWEQSPKLLLHLLLQGQSAI